MAKGDPIFIARLPWRCELTGLDKPECHCATCQGELERKHRPCCGQGCSRCMRKKAMGGDII